MRYVTKDFLSASPDESGSVICKITTARVKDMSEYSIRDGGRIDGTLRISDCSDHVEIDFYAVGENNFKKRVEKFDLLLEKVQAMREQYVAMWENHQRDIEHFKKTEGIK